MDEEKDLRFKAESKKNTRYTRAVLELIPGYIISGILRSREVIFYVYIPSVRRILYNLPIFEICSSKKNCQGFTKWLNE